MKYGIIGREELKQMIDSKKPFTLIDVRNPEEIEHGMLPGAYHISLNDIPLSLWMSPSEWEKKFGFAKPTNQDLIVFYDYNGVKSTQAAAHAASMRYTAATFNGGIVAWSEIDPNVKKY